MPKPLIEQLRDALADFDGNAVSMLSEAAARHSDHPDYDLAIVRLCQEPDEMVQRAAAWLVLDRARNGAPFEPAVIDTLAAALPTVTDWQAELALLQALDVVTAPPSCAPAFAAFAEARLAHTRPFIRAWAMNALCRLAQLDASLTERAEAARLAGLDDPAASVRARARQCKPPRA